MSPAGSLPEPSHARPSCRTCRQTRPTARRCCAVTAVAPWLSRADWTARCWRRRPNWPSAIGPWPSPVRAPAWRSASSDEARATGPADRHPSRSDPDRRVGHSGLSGEPARSLLPLQDRVVHASGAAFPAARRGGRGRRQQSRRSQRVSPGPASRPGTTGAQPVGRVRTQQAGDPPAGRVLGAAHLGQARGALPEQPHRVWRAGHARNGWR